MVTVFLILMVLLSVGPALLLASNWRLYRSPSFGPEVGTAEGGDGSASPAEERISVLIPARNEASSIAEAVAAALGSQGVEVEVIVLDDHSEDETSEIVGRLASKDGRVRLASAPALPAGWCGKQHACFRLAEMATYPVLAFVDADVRLAPRGLRGAVTFLRESEAGLVSGIPHQRTETFLEKLLIPLIHFVLLAYLPIGRMRGSASPAYGAGCGQLFVADRDAYFRAGGHAAIRGSFHDGIMLPRAFRRAGVMTDLFDCDRVASCRMYDGGRAVWNGLAKNATEAMAAPGAIVPWTIILSVGQVAPLFAFVLLWRLGEPRWMLAASGLAVLANYGIRLALAWRFRQSLLSALLHPFGVAVLLTIQWYALIRKMAGVPAVWRGRSVVAAPIEASVTNP